MRLYEKKDRLIRKNPNLTDGQKQEIGGNFDCIYNPNLHSLEGIGEVKGKIYKDF